MAAVTDAEYQAAVTDFLDELDREILARRRTEQDYLRALLFPGPEAACHLCGRQFRSEFLIAAHIKKRAACTDHERRDAHHVVMAACRFGCDELFERGYITAAEDGTLLISQALEQDSHAHQYASQHLADKTLAVPMAGREDYFEWHRKHSFRG